MPKNKKKKNFWKAYFGVTNPSLVSETLYRLPWKEEDISDEDLKYLSQRIRSVSQMDLDFTHITNQGVEYLSGMKIKELRLKGLNINDASIEHIKQISGLTLLHIGGTNISSIGITSLGEISTLETLICTPHPIDPQALNKFKKMLPNCELIVNYQPFNG